ncbi:adenosylcobinamide-phosphate synthase [Litoreibacter ascidiaceicola]|uniref:Cobalamin biosynthesis protein CobD n=1 Tax=Litoreibacter ascidiaceicola TaxID=1486859 RepID=A0A1M5ALU6_9RHOB|nr:adenosylcobinamide-phosphate synthase CbiB [Litoreibacter ascidiaceicola]SHF31136.1 adenosylcobinamide-phosphate synthase [Litoreibacter ascidiaceicola]
MTVVFAMLLDAVLGEPKWLWDRVPHPAVLMGQGISWLETRLNTGKDRRAKGILLIVLLVAAALVAGAVLSAFGPLVEIVIGAILIAQRSLADHVSDVARALRLSLGDGRIMVARIVGRDVKTLDQSGVARGAIESAAENLSDGVIAPVFWFALLGLPGLLAYKIINTADSMVGYKNDRYEEFGWASARLDDLVNWPAARLTAILIALVHLRPNAMGVAQRDAGLHRSPNAGWPEAAMASVLGISLSGPRSYDGTLRDEPYVNPEGRHSAGPDDIDASVTVLWKAWGLTLAFVALWGVIA